jgi:hypothetical protein
MECILAKLADEVKPASGDASVVTIDDPGRHLGCDARGISGWICRRAP